LRPAQGFFDLGMFEAAWANLDNLEPSAKARPESTDPSIDINDLCDWSNGHRIYPR
jgi:hypothetical protein